MLKLKLILFFLDFQNISGKSFQSKFSSHLLFACHSKMISNQANISRNWRKQAKTEIIKQQVNATTER